MKVTAQIDGAAIMKARGLNDNRAQKFLASEIRRRCDKRVPFSSGQLKNENNVVISSDGSTITYTQPYAHYQYYGRVMGPNYTDGKGRFWSGKAPKSYTGKSIRYHDEPMRGAKWDKRMMADEGDELVRDIAKFVGGEAK